MDYTRVNLDLVKNGEMYAVVGQPLWDESFLAAKLLKKAAAGEKEPYWTPMEAPIITVADVDQYYKMLADAEAMFKAPAAAAAAEGDEVLLDSAGEGSPGAPAHAGCLPDVLQGRGDGVRGGRAG